MGVLIYYMHSGGSPYSEKGQLTLAIRYMSCQTFIWKNGPQQCTIQIVGVVER